MPRYDKTDGCRLLERPCIIIILHWEDTMHPDVSARCILVISYSFYQYFTHSHEESLWNSKFSTFSNFEKNAIFRGYLGPLLGRILKICFQQSLRMCILSNILKLQVIAFFRCRDILSLVLVFFTHLTHNFMTKNLKFKKNILKTDGDCWF